MITFGIGIGIIVILLPWLVIGWLFNLVDGKDTSVKHKNIKHHYDEISDNMFYVGYINGREKYKQRELERRNYYD